MRGPTRNVKVYPQPECTSMRVRILAMTIALSTLPCLAAAQNAPVSEAFRDQATRASKDLIDAANEMPADKYTFKPTPAQMSFGDIVAHLVEGNDYLCGVISGAKAPTRAKVTGASSKDVLVGELKDTFAFCNESLAKLDDSKLSEQLPFFGARRARART